MIRDTRHPTLGVSRTALLVVGGGMMIAAFLADRLGYGDVGSFGIGQLLLALAGLVVSLIGLLGKRFLSLYRQVAVHLLNTLVLLALLELLAILVGRSTFQIRQAGIQDVPYYADQDWSELYWREAGVSESYHYQPYVVWRHLPFSGQMININQEGIRQTPGAECGDGAYKVFAFGGSTMWGWGSPDWGTIPAYLQSGFEALSEGPVCVMNFGEDGYHSTQSLIALTLQLQAGNVPDLVIFYDGVNEVIAAYESGQPSVHVTLAKVAARFEGQEHPLLTWGKSTRTYALLRRWTDRPEQARYGASPEMARDSESTFDTASLADSVSDTYLRNYSLVGALAQEYGFDYFFFLQPHLAVGEKALTRDEQTMRSGIDPTLAELARAVYTKIALAASDSEHLWYIADVFDEEETQIWIDEVGHITPEGNRLVAQVMLAAFASSR